MAVTPDNTFIRIASKDFTSASPGALGEDPTYGGTTVPGMNSTPFIEYKVNLPKAGKWYFHANFSAQESRQAALTINGVKQTQPVCGNVTGTWYPDSRKWFVYGPFDFKQGENVFRLDFANWMPPLKEFGFSESMLGVAKATVWAADLVAPRDVVTIGDGSYSNLIYTSKAKPSYIEWKVNLPEAGQYHLHALLTAAESRPGTLSINGVKQSGEILGQVTGSWYSDKLTWVQHGPYEFKQGENVLRVDFPNYHAHLRELGFTSAKAAEKPAQPTLEKRNISGTVNEFAGVTAIAGNTLTLAGSTNPFNAGDRIVVIQMAGAVIDTSDTDKFGTITNIGGAGQYVWAKVVSVEGQSVKLDTTDLNGFDAKGQMQIVRACAHGGDIAITGHIAAPQWNGTTGGVIVVEAAGTLELAEDIDASARGFVGGAKGVQSGSMGCLGYIYPASAGAGNKGAGIATLGADQAGGRGAAANGGGGGNPHNAGGGGGGNGGAGGRGAAEYQGVTGGPKDNGGLGGRALDYGARAFMGGGGGAGQDNHNVSTGGGNGGGIIILRAKAIVSLPGASGRFIRSNGGAAGTAGTDGGGGGGAGGTIILDTPTITGALTVQANGGRGGDCGAEHGYGAGGGGGTVRSVNPLPTSVTGSVLPGDPGSCGRPRGHIVADKGIIGLLPARPVASTSASAEELQKLRDTIKTLEDKIAELEAALAKCSGCCAKVDALTSDLAALRAKLDAATNENTALQAKLTALTDELAVLRAKLDERDTKCAVHEQKITALEKKLVEHERVHADLEKAIAKQEHSNIEQERKLLEQDRKIAEQERSNIEQERKLLDQDKKLAEQAQKNIEQERTLLEQDKKILAQDRKFADYDAVIAALEAKLAKCGDCATKISELEGKLAKCGDCETKIAEQEKTIADLTERLAKLEATPVVVPPEAKPEAKPEEKTVLPPVWPPPTTPARMVISYIHFVGMEKNTQGDEYIEIKNTGGTAQDVTGWRVRAGSASQEFTFPAGSNVAPGATCRVYTNRSGSFSFNAKRAVWNDSGDVGMLYDKAGTLVSEFGYGTKETRTLESIKATYGVERMKVVYEDAQITKQKRKNDKIDFLTAVERAIRSLLEDPADADGLNAANQVRDNFDGVPPNASAEVIQSFIRDTMNKGELHLLATDAPDLTDLDLTTKDQWLFRLDPGMGDMHWVIVERMGAKAAYQEIT